MNYDALIIATVMVAFAGMIGAMGYSIGYQHGQVDSASGKQKYKLIEFKDGSISWVKNPKESDYDSEIKIIK